MASLDSTYLVSAFIVAGEGVLTVPVQVDGAQNSLCSNDIVIVGELEVGGRVVGVLVSVTAGENHGATNNCK